MTQCVNRTGQVFGRLTCLRRVSNKKSKRVWWLCQCTCGSKKKVSSLALVRGYTKSCGCLRRELMIKKKTTHGFGKGDSYYYRLWKNIKTRCTNPNYIQWKDYGGRGITCYLDWLTNFELFYNYVFYTLGPRPSNKYSLDRHDNNKGYEPGNLRWATSYVQSTNKRPRTRKTISQ